MEQFFWRGFFGGFLGEFFGRNSLFTLLKSAKLFEYERIDLFVEILVFVKILIHRSARGKLMALKKKISNSWLEVN